MKVINGDDIICVIASLPWREGNLRALCRDLVVQRVVPGEVFVILDGYPERARVEFERDLVTLEGGPRFTVQRNEQAKGPGERWRMLARMAERLVREAGSGPRAVEALQKKIAVIIDDDFRVGADYVEKTVEGFTADDVGMVGWSGTTWDAVSKYGVEETDLWCAAAGMSAVRIAPMAGIESYPAVDEYFGIGGDDEALVSYWMWQQKLRVVRPPGGPDMRSIDSLQHDRRASHRNHNHRHFIQRITLLQQHGWAPPTPPPFPNPGAIRSRQP